MAFYSLRDAQLRDDIAINIGSKYNIQELLSIGEDEDRQYEQDRFTDTYNENFTVDSDYESQRFNDDDAKRENFTD